LHCPIELILYRAIGSGASLPATDANGSCFPEASKPEQSDYATEKSGAFKRTENSIAG
jgi:hypothetical protein